VDGEEGDVSMNNSMDAQDPLDSEAESQVSEPPPVPRGKVLRRIAHDHDVSSDDDDEDDAMNHNDDNHDPEAEDENHDEDEDDVLQVASVVAEGEEDIVSEAETSIVVDEEETSIATPFKDNDTFDKDVAVAEVVMDGNDSDDASEVAAVIAEVVPKKIRKKPGPKPKNKDGKKKETSSSKKKKSSGDGKKRGKGGTSGSDVGKGLTHGAAVSREKLEAAKKARDVLLSSLKETPFRVSDSHVIQNFGRIIVENDESAETLFSNSTALYPIGFSCDRYEFSPVHGRILKLRCEILDGGRIEVEKRSSLGDSTSGTSEKYKGPYFRITWGQGIDELDDGKPFPFDLYTASAPIGNDVDTVAVPMGLDVPIIPEAGMRVKVRFEDGLWSRGMIKKVMKKNEEQETKEKKKGGKSISKNRDKDVFVLSIVYDDGMKEEIAFPDPDVMLISPGMFVLDL
jgi:hypothetical protein